MNIFQNKSIIKQIFIFFSFYILQSIQQSQELYRQRHGSYYFYSYIDSVRGQVDVNPKPITSNYRDPIARRGQVREFVDRHNKKRTEVVFETPDPTRRSLTPLVRDKRDDSEEEVVDTNTSSDDVEVDREVMSRIPDPTIITRRFKLSLSQIVLKNCGYSKAMSSPNTRIVNGVDAKEGAHPWMAAILKLGDNWCGGTILNERWIITASHCFMEEMDPKAYVVRVGNNDRNRGKSYKIAKILMHERFHLDNMFNSDIALMKTEKPIKMADNVNGICLQEREREEPKTTSLLVAGWGATEYQGTDMPINLQEVTLPRISDGNCARKYHTKANTVYKSQLCTWAEGKDSCQGDSGGPAIEVQNDRAVLIGIISYGYKCADKLPGIYTQVSYFLKWIKTKISQDLRSTSRRPRYNRRRNEE